jgi:hypothetical protein
MNNINRKFNTEFYAVLACESRNKFNLCIGDVYESNLSMLDIWLQLQNNIDSINKIINEKHK